MTALAGLWRYDRKDVGSDCQRMLSSQALYGPDSCSLWSNGSLALGRQLKRLLPEDDFDRQPLHGGGGRYDLVADLRLDNREELAELLQLPKERVARCSDAALLLAAFERWGEYCVEKLVGVYAFAIWDNENRRLILARDPLGQRPLYFYRDDRFFAVASMPKGLHALADVPYEIVEDHIVESFFPVSAVDTRTYFRGVERVLPGHIISISKDGFSARCYWEPRIRRLGLRTPDDYCEGLRDVLDQAVKCRLRGAKDVGAELSGGLDSSAVAATAARLLAPTGGKVISFTAVPREGYDGPVPRNRIANEAPLAAATAGLYPNMEHVLIHSEGKSLFDSLDRDFMLFDGPTGALFNAVWGNELFNRARERDVTVLLNGMMGNMGLSYNGMELLGELVGSGRLLRFWREASALTAQQEIHWRGALVQGLGPWCPTPIWLWIHRIFSNRGLEPASYSPISPRRIAELNLRRRARENGLDIHYRPWKNSIAMRRSMHQMYDSGGANKGFLGGWGIDRRDPTSDVRLLEFCLSVPTEQFLSNGVQRALARRALKDRLPEVVLKETRRGVQAADWHEVLNADRDRIKVELERLHSCPAAVRVLDLPRMSALVANWPKGGWNEPDVISSYRFVLSAAISTGHFLRRVSGSNF